MNVLPLSAATNSFATVCEMPTLAAKAPVVSCGSHQPVLLDQAAQAARLRLFQYPGT